jgi:hypothetical protein
MLYPAPALSLTPTQSEIQTLAQAPASQADRERQDKIREAWKAFRGEFPNPLNLDKDQPDHNILSNRCGPIVTTGTSFLFGPTLKIECSEQDFVDNFWGDDDNRMTLLSQISINGGVTGQPFVKLIPNQDSPQHPPRIVVQNPELIRVITEPDDCMCPLAYVIEYPGINEYQKRQIIARIDPNADLATAGDDVKDTWTITNYARRGGFGRWFPISEPDPWPYCFAPLFSCQNLPNPNEFWGVPDLTPDLIGMNKNLNFVQSDTAHILYHHGHPVTYATGVNASQINMSVDALICLPSENSKLEKLAAMENFAGLLQFAETLRSDMDEQSRVPAVALGRLVELPKGNISGVALQLLFKPMIDKTVQKQRLYGSLIRDITRAALVIGGKISEDEYKTYPVDVHWQDLLPIDDLAAAQTALILQQIGISSDTIQRQLGYDPDNEFDKSVKEDQKKMDAYANGQALPPVQQMQQTNPMQTQQVSTNTGGKAGGGNTGGYKAGHHY